MSRLTIAVYLALMIAPFIGIAVTAPFVWSEYKRTKLIHVSRCAQLYLMIFFFLCAYFMTMLPFPSFESVAAMTGETIQPIPFYCFYDFFVNSDLNIQDWSSIFPALGGSIFLGIVFNVIMLLPIGFFFHSLFDCSIQKALLIGFLISLLFELTQLSGLFFIYPRPYRLFDVDDLIQNTLGFWIGFILQPKLNSLIPSARKTQTIHQGGEVSMRRRLLADLIDQLLILAGIAILLAVLNRFGSTTVRSHMFAAFLVLYFLAVLLLGLVMQMTHGRSLGMICTGLQLRSVFGNDHRLHFVQNLIRCLSLGIVFLLPILIYQLIDVSSRLSRFLSIICVFLSAFLVFLNVIFLLQLLLNTITHGSPLLFEKLSRTHLGLYPNAKSLRKLRPLYTGRLFRKEIQPGIEPIYQTLCKEGIDSKKSMRVQYMAEGILIEWMENGLNGRVFDVLLDERFLHKTIMINIPGPEVALSRNEESFLEILSGTRLSFDLYYTGGSNIFAIDVP